MPIERRELEGTEAYDEDDVRSVAISVREFFEHHERLAFTAEDLKRVFAVDLDSDPVEAMVRDDVEVVSGDIRRVSDDGVVPYHRLQVDAIDGAEAALLMEAVEQLIETTYVEVVEGHHRPETYYAYANPDVIEEVLLG